MNLKHLLSLPPGERMDTYMRLRAEGKITYDDVARNENMNLVGAESPFDEAQAWADEAARNGDPELGRQRGRGMNDWQDSVLVLLVAGLALAAIALAGAVVIMIVRFA